MTKSNQALKTIFSSDTRIRVLSHFFLHPGENFYLRQLSRLINKPVGQLRHELMNLESIHLFNSIMEGNQKRYYINRDFPIYDELKSIFLKTLSTDTAIRESIEALKGVELAFIYGSFAKGEEHIKSDIDIMIVGDAKDEDVSVAVSKIESKLNKMVNYSLYDRKEVKTRLKKKDNFITTVFSEPHIILIGKEDDELFKTHKR